MSSFASRQTKEGASCPDEERKPVQKLSDAGATIPLDNWQHQNRFAMSSSQTVSSIQPPAESALHAPQPVRLSPTGRDAYNEV
jgi:hypothetical protein